MGIHAYWGVGWGASGEGYTCTRARRHFALDVGCVSGRSGRRGRLRAGMRARKSPSRRVECADERPNAIGRIGESTRSGASCWPVRRARDRVEGPRMAERLDLSHRAGRARHEAVCSENSANGSSLPQCGQGAVRPDALAIFSSARLRMFVGEQRQVGHLAQAGCLEQGSHKR